MCSSASEWATAGERGGDDGGRRMKARTENLGPKVKEHGTIHMHRTVEATTNNFIQRAELTLEFEILIEL